MKTRTPIVIAIDGPSGSGKSTASRSTAKALGFLHVDTGAMYRLVTWAVLHHGISPDDKNAVIALLPGLSPEMRFNVGGVQWWPNGAPPGAELRSPEAETAE